jgi:hypothetical protein
MKKIIIEISDSQHEEMKSFLEKCFSTSASEDCMGMDDYNLKLQTGILGSTLDVELYGKVELGDVNWHIE